MLTDSLGTAEFFRELRLLNLHVRHKVRAILSAGEDEALKLFNQLREKTSAHDLVQVERVLRLASNRPITTVPQPFPQRLQLAEDFRRAAPVGLKKQLEILALLAHGEQSKLLEFALAMKNLNASLVGRKFLEACTSLVKIGEKFGRSHLLLRKAALLKSLSTEQFPYVDDLLQEAGLAGNSVIATSLLHCYSPETDYLTLKKSIMNLTSRGDANKFTRDIARIPFHPFAKNAEDLCHLLQSALQSSLVDGLIIAKVNSLVIEADWDQRSLPVIFRAMEGASADIGQVASLFLPADGEGEHLFMKRSSAWLESREIARYRAFQDHFNDPPESEYSKIRPEIIAVANEWAEQLDLNQLSISKLTKHNIAELLELEEAGTLTRSSMFNFVTHATEGYTAVGERELLELMGRTRDLVKTIDPVYVSRLAKLASSKLAKLVLYLLIAKKSKNELDDHHLRRIFQDVAKLDFGGSITALLEHIRTMSSDVANYAYDVCTEDFIAKLFHLVSSSSEIADTRAALHKWMGQVTGEQVYFDRARTLLIDHQLNKIRNEIDDNRIYVDAGRFAEWFSDEASRDLGVILAGLAHKNELQNFADPQLTAFVDQCYQHFCSNKIFGIASYLGRRIRHGTFKGHLYSGVISIERLEKFAPLMSDSNFATKWAIWKASYEAKIVEIIRDRLHIESQTKREGLLRPAQNSPGRQEAWNACAKALIREYVEGASLKNAASLVTEYCWRVAEVDLKAINAFLKNRRAALVNVELLVELRGTVHDSALAKDFVRDLVRSIDEKLMAMHNWFKRPVIVSPKASLSLLYKAVVAEVQETFPGFQTQTEYQENEDIELVGGVYHVFYDSFYVTVYNAAKHGHEQGQLRREFSLVAGEGGGILLKFAIKSAIRDGESEDAVNERLTVDAAEDIDNAQLSEDRSGLRKLYHLQQVDPNFKIESIGCANREVTVALSYWLEH